MKILHGLPSRWLMLAFLIVLPITLCQAADGITVLYDAFGKTSDLQKDWGFSALIEYRGKRILFDTGDNAEIFAHNVKVKNIDLASLDFAVISHRHSDHISGIPYLLQVNPRLKIYAPKENFGIFGSSLPSGFYRRNASLPEEKRYFDGQPPDVMRFGKAWPEANFELVEKTTEIAPGIFLVALVSNNPGTLELRELSLVIKTAKGLVVVVGCSHPGIEKILEAATTIDSHIHLIVGGLHLVMTSDQEVQRISLALKDAWKVEHIAPGHCTGEPAFEMLSGDFGDRYIYAGLGTTIPLDNAASASGKMPEFTQEDRMVYRTYVAAEIDETGR